VYVSPHTSNIHVYTFLMYSVTKNENVFKFGFVELVSYSMNDYMNHFQSFFLNTALFK